MQISFDGSSIAKGATPTISSSLSKLMAAVTAGDSTGMTQGSTRSAVLIAPDAQSHVGIGLNVLDDARVRLNSQKLDTGAQLSATEDANMAAAISQMSKASTAYQAALGALGRIGSLSLMDYLK